MKKLVLFSLFLAAVVIILGAYTRLTDAGLGCPDWPGCYGNLTVPLSDAKVVAANTAFPERPVEVHKAWNEMIHRYFAGALGLCILAIAIIAFKQRHQGTPVKLPLLLLVLVIFQAALGMWTVTLNLLPVVVMGHLLGGFTVLSCLFLLYLRLRKHSKVMQTNGLKTSEHERAFAGQTASGFCGPNDTSETASVSTYSSTTTGLSNSVSVSTLGKSSKLTRLAFVGIVILVGQIALGGWTSANYAALACTDMPICEPGWQQRLDFSGAYSVPEAENYEFGAHNYGERATMHIVHRFGAAITFIYLTVLAFTWLRSSTLPPSVKKGCVLMLAVLCAQVALGLSNVLFSLPLFIAVSHNAVAAILLLTLIWLTWSVIPSSSSFSYPTGGHHG
ncbi:COX15/CtaA family protein [Alteromonas sp. 1_MG-2023]|uniref:COX15/CtaA family protein n=1 Tax=Alteromonas sp. 1_MG-2023 TaxID=3062669 RepID=UPI0026E12014|nr:COX15/CtaA family protein [Alteromonas sp. 1_MG-2023]MDO6566836.1 COX15/CtaA family protein [Alteromonas sp. 1_MG-2023]